MKVPARLKLIMEVITALPDECPEPDVDVGAPCTVTQDDIIFDWSLERGRSASINVDIDGSLLAGALVDGHTWSFHAQDSEAAKIIVSKITEVTKI